MAMALARGAMEGARGYLVLVSPAAIGAAVNVASWHLAQLMCTQMGPWTTEAKQAWSATDQ